MQPTFCVVINRTDERRPAAPADIDRVCADLAGRTVFTANVLGERGFAGPTLDLIVESGRALVFYMDMDRGIKLVSRDEMCAQRGVVSLRNDAHPELDGDQVEVHQRDLVFPGRAISILRHYLTTGEVTDLVPWPPDDWDEWGDDIGSDEGRQGSDGRRWSPDEEIPF
jgi:hypothetical protein